jgi:hypothetical protein
VGVPKWEQATFAEPFTTRSFATFAKKKNNKVVFVPSTLLYIKYDC